MYRRLQPRPDGSSVPFPGSGLDDLRAGKAEGSGPGGPLPSGTGEVGWALAQRVADGVDLLAGVAAQGAQGYDADDGDEGQEERVLHQGGATLGEIGRASCRERVEVSEVDEGFKKRIGRPNSRGCGGKRCIDGSNPDLMGHPSHFPDQGLTT